MKTFFVNNKKAIFTVVGVTAGAAYLIWAYQRSKEIKPILKLRSPNSEKKIAPVPPVSEEKTSVVPPVSEEKISSVPPVSEEKISPVPKQEQLKEDEIEFLAYSLNSPEYQVMIQLGPEQDLSLSKEVKALIVQSVEVKSENGHLTIIALSTLETAVKLLSFPKFYALLKQFRQERRGDGFDEERYIAAQAEFVKGLKEVLKQGTLEILAEIKVSEADFEKSSQHHRQFTVDDFLTRMRLDWFELFDSFDGKKVNPDQLLEIINAQTQLYNNENENVQKLRDSHRNLSHADAVELIQSKIDDQIYQKYNVEPENYAKFNFSNMSESEREAAVNNYTAKEMFTK